MLDPKNIPEQHTLNRIPNKAATTSMTGKKIRSMQPVKTSEPQILLPSVLAD